MLSVDVSGGCDDFAELLDLGLSVLEPVNCLNGIVPILLI